MTSCIDTTAFALVDGVLVPHEHLQWRHVATASGAGVERTYPRAAGAVNDLLVTVQAVWTNATPITQNVYALVTREGSRIELGPRNRATVSQYLGVASGAAPADPATVLASRTGGGIDTGTAGIFNYDDYSIYEDRGAPCTAMFPAAVVALPAGQQYKARCELRFVSDNWTGSNVDGGVSEGAQTNTVSTGSTRVDLYAYPAL